MRKPRWIVSVVLDDRFNFLNMKHECQGDCDVDVRLPGAGGNIVEIEFSRFWWQDAAGVVEEIIGGLKRRGVDVIRSEQLWD